MSYSCSDLSDLVIQLLGEKGYWMHNGNAETGQVVDDETGEDWWFTYGRPDGRGDIECGETWHEELPAWSEALEHYFKNTDIEWDLVADPEHEAALDRALGITRNAT